MGLMIISKAMSALKTAGFRVQRAYPGEKMPAITEIVAAVKLDGMDLVEEKSVVEAKILCPHTLGAAACEDASVMAAEALQTAGFRSRVGAVEFDGKTGLFCATCIASVQERWQASVYIPFKIGAVEQSWVVSFSSQRQITETEPELGQIPWLVRLEQFFPYGAMEDRDPDGDEFTLTNGSEIYHGCKWISHLRATEAGGIRQIREGTSMYRTIS